MAKEELHLVQHSENRELGSRFRASFVKAMDQDATARTLVATIISLAHSMQLKVAAEGVETEQQAEILRELQCDQMQGYLFSKPLPAEALTKLPANELIGRDDVDERCVQLGAEGYF